MNSVAEQHLRFAARLPEGEATTGVCLEFDAAFRRQGGPGSANSPPAGGFYYAIPPETQTVPSEGAKSSKGVLEELSILHNRQKVLLRIFDELDIRNRVAVDE